MPEITAVWFYRPRDAAAFHGTLIARRMELEKPLGNPDLAQLKESYDRWGPIVKKIGFTADS